MRGAGVAFGMRGFTLMEMLVTLMLVSFATMLMFQMLGSYRLANERVRVQSGGIDRRALFHAWFRQSVHGLYIADGLEFGGDGDRFRGTSLNPLYAVEGVPTVIEWRLLRAGDGVWIAYLENGSERWRQPLASGGARFVYLDAEGRRQDAWPPRGFGLKDNIPTLPASVLLLQGRDGDARSLVASVLGPLEPVLRLTGDEDP